MKPFAAMAFAFALTAAGPVLALTPGDAEATLRATIADFQNGSPDYSSMTPAIAEAFRTHPEAGQKLAALGPATVIVVARKTNPFSFVVTFEGGAVMNWTISFDEAGRIDKLDAAGR